MIWRVVINKIAGLEEIEKHYDVLDLLDANESLDLVEEAERRAAQKAKAG